MFKTEQYIQQVLNVIDERASQDQKLEVSDMKMLQQKLGLTEKDIHYLDTRFAEFRDHAKM